MIKKIIIVLIILMLAAAGYYLSKGHAVQKKTDQQQTIQDKAVLEIDGSDFVITEKGIVQRKNENNNLPKIFLPSQITPAENAHIGDAKVTFALTLIQNLTKTDFTPTQVRFVDEVDIIVYSQSEATALFTVNKDAIFQVDSLQSVLSKAKMNAAKITKIDLRFDKPVVTYK